MWISCCVFVQESLGVGAWALHGVGVRVVNGKLTQSYGSALLVQSFRVSHYESKPDCCRFDPQIDCIMLLQILATSFESVAHVRNVVE